MAHSPSEKDQRHDLRNVPPRLVLTWGSLLLIHIDSRILLILLSHSLPSILASTAGVHSTGKRKDRSTSFWWWVSPRMPELSSRELIFGFALMNFNWFFSSLKSFSRETDLWVTSGDFTINEAKFGKEFVTFGVYSQLYASRCAKRFLSFELKLNRYWQNTRVSWICPNFTQNSQKIVKVI